MEPLIDVRDMHHTFAGPTAWEETWKLSAALNESSTICTLVDLLIFQPLGSHCYYKCLENLLYWSANFHYRSFHLSRYRPLLRVDLFNFSICFIWIWSFSFSWFLFVNNFSSPLWKLSINLIWKIVKLVNWSVLVALLTYLHNMGRGGSGHWTWPFRLQLI